MARLRPWLCRAFFNAMKGFWPIKAHYLQTEAHLIQWRYGYKKNRPQKFLSRQN